MRRARPLLPAVAVALVALVLAACGNAVPANSVATVEDQGPITRQQFDRWFKIAAASIQPQGAQGKPVVPRPPDFAECIQARRKVLPKPPEGQQPPSDQELRQTCRQEYEALRDEVLQFLISAAWVQGEAQEKEVSVSQKEVDQRYQQEREASFQSQQDYRRFLEQTGYREEDLKMRVRLSLLQQKLVDKLTEGSDRISNEEVRRYYRDNQEQFTTPEARDLRLVLTETKKEAREAREALESGDPWSEVAKEFSKDEQTASQGGMLTGVTRQGGLEPSVAKAIFSAEKGELTGPVESQLGFYVFQVQGVDPAKRRSVEEAAAQIRQTISGQRQEKILDRFIEEFTKRWTERTDCRDEFVVQSCSNAPDEPQGGENAPPGAVPDGGAPQQVPPGGVPQQVPPGGAQQVPVPPQGGGAPQQVPVPPQGGGGQQQVPVPPQGG